MDKKLFYVRIGNSIADTIIRMKQSLAENHNIPFMVQASLPSDLVVSDMDIANILGNLLDNALEASQKEEQPYINITLKEKGNWLLFDICNRCTRKINEEKSSKQDAQFHGIGLKSVKKTVAKYNGELLIEQKNEEYRVSIVLQNEQPAE